MSKPWLERLECIRGGPFSKNGPVLVDGAGYPIADVRDDDGLGEILSAAPDMCRALLIAEWADTSGVENINMCPACFAQGPLPNGGSWLVKPINGGHAVPCALDTALTKAGLATQEQREAARKELGT